MDDVTRRRANRRLKRSPNRSKPKVKAITNKNSPAAPTFFFSRRRARSRLYDAPFQFASDFSRYAYFSGRVDSPRIDLYDDTWGEAVLLSALPGTGKDTRIKKTFSDLPVISLDDLRDEMKIAPEDGSILFWPALAKSARNICARNARSFGTRRISPTSPARRSSAFAAITARPSESFTSKRLGKKRNAATRVVPASSRRALSSECWANSNRRPSATRRESIGFSRNAARTSARIAPTVLTAKIDANAPPSLPTARADANVSPFAPLPFPSAALRRSFDVARRFFPLFRAKLAARRCFSASKLLYCKGGIGSRRRERLGSALVFLLKPFLSLNFNSRRRRRKRKCRDR